ncbi:MAG TPA: transcriptional regulator [Gammaproteobacteria bacterium]
MARRAAHKDKDRAPPPGKVERLRTVSSYVADKGLKDFDRLIYERVRLGIMSALSVNESMTFNELKALLKTTDGNLSAHSRKLEEAGYIACRKSFSARMPKTEYSLTPKGKRVLERYLSHMESLINAARG